MGTSSGSVEAVLLAAGLGTRMLPFTQSIAKSFLPLVGNPTIQYSLDWLNEQGVSKAVVNLHHLYDDSLARLKKLDRGKVEISVSDERRELLGSAGGVRQAMEKISGSRFLLVNSDTLYFPNINSLLCRHEELHSRFGVEATLAVFEKSPSGAIYREIVTDPVKNTVTGIHAKKKNSSFFAGVGIFEKTALQTLPIGKPSDLLLEVLMPFSQTGKLGVWMTDGMWLDLGEPRQWFDAHFELIKAAEQDLVPTQVGLRVQKVLKNSDRVFFDLKRKIYSDALDGKLPKIDSNFNNCVAYAAKSLESNTLEFAGQRYVLF